MSGGRPNVPPHAPHLLVLAIAVALSAGVLNVSITFVWRELFLIPMEGNAHLLWMAPAADLILFVPAAVLLHALHRVFPNHWVERGAMAILFALGLFATLTSVPQIHYIALAVLVGAIAWRGSYFAVRARERVYRFTRRVALILTGLLGVFACTAFARSPLREWRAHRALPASPADAPNVLFLVLDTVRAMSLSLYGYDRPTTPRLEQWARTSTVFDQAVSTAPWTLPSHASMMTGRWPHELSVGFETPLDTRFPTLAEAMAQRGYSTAAFTANRKYVSYEHGLDRGFAHVEDFDVSVEQMMVSSALGQRFFWSPRVRRATGLYDLFGRKSAGMVDGELESWLTRRDRARPFFAFVNYFDAHEPYLPPPPYDLRFTSDSSPRRPARLTHLMSPTEIAREREAYEGSISYLDAEIDHMLRDLEARGLLRNTLVIITADHGEQFGEHGRVDHGNSLYRPLIDVPLVLRFPGRVPEGRRIAAPVSLRDIPSTVLDLVGRVAHSPFPGASLARYWRTSSDDSASRSATNADGSTQSEPILSEVSRPNGEFAYAIRSDGESYIDWFGETTELYDLRRDPRELDDLMHQSDADTRPANKSAVFERIAGGPVKRLEELPPMERRWRNLARDLFTLSARAWGRGVDQVPSAASVAR